MINVLLYIIGFFVWTYIISPIFEKLPPFLFIILTYGMFIVWFFVDNTFIKYWNYFVSFPVVIGSLGIWLITKLKIIK